MFVVNGIVYAGEPKGPLKVTCIKRLEDRMMLVTFSTGETSLFDASILNKGVFERLQSDDIFNSAELDRGVITWDRGNIDCAPEFIYKNSYEYPAPEVI